MNNIRLVQENGIPNIQKKLWYVDNSSEINLNNFEAGDRIYSINDNKLYQIEYDSSTEQEYSGEIVSFEADEDDRISSLEVEINPVQDLHGYDNPWPAGGGVQLIPYPYRTEGGTYKGATLTFDAYGIGHISGTATGTTTVNLISFHLKAGTYTIAQFETSLYTRVYLHKNSTLLISLDNDDPKYTFTVEDDDELTYAVLLLAGTYNNDTVAAMIVSGSTAPTNYSPYSNECPISGHTGMTVARTGKNLFDKSNANILNAYYATGQNQVIHAGSSFRCVWLPCKPNTTYTIINPAKGRASIAYTTVEPADNVPVYNAATNTTTTGSDAKYIVMYVWNSTTDTATFDDVLNSLQIELGSTASTYEPYTGTTIPITFPETIYGGSDEVIGGVLQPLYAEIDLGDIPWISEDPTIGRFRTNSLGNVSVFSGKLPAYTANFVCSIYKSAGLRSYDYGVNGTIFYTNNGAESNIIRINDNTKIGVSAADFIAAVRGQKLVYELNTPPDPVQLSANELNTLYGQNNVWTDVGEINAKVIKNDMTAFELKPHI